MSFFLSENHKRHAQVYQHVAELMRPYWQQLERQEKIPDEVIEILRQYKLLGIPMPEKYGGGGKDYLSGAMCIEYLSKTNPSVAGVINVTTELVSVPILKNASDFLKDKYLTPLASGASIGAFGLTEPNAGSDTSAAETTAVKKDGHWVLNGRKKFITNAELADIFLVGAVTELPDGRRKISEFIVEKSFPGFSLGKIERKMGIRASSTGELVFENCIVPEENLVGTLGKGLSYALNALEYGRVMIAAQAVGIAQGAIDETVAALKEKNSERLSRQWVQFKLAELQTKTEAARLMVYRAAAKADTGENFGMESSQAKLFASETANEVTRACVDILGAEGCMKDTLAELMFRDAKITEIYEGTNEIQRLIIAGNMELKG
ncbi:MAG: acyl-CoA dehydrogenase family protein [Oscillospiraceae bacterium]|nr:acyl-CoA dehydrogenase family protein [Oscillospiraceae bacterium]